VRCGGGVREEKGVEEGEKGRLIEKDIEIDTICTFLTCWCLVYSACHFLMCATRALLTSAHLLCTATSRAFKASSAEILW
jgi:hypothetical protein